MDPAINKIIAMPVSYCTSFDDNTGRSLSRHLNRGINYKRWPGQDVAQAKGRLLHSDPLNIRESCRKFAHTGYYEIEAIDLMYMLYTRG